MGGLKTWLQFFSSMPQGVVAVTGWPNQRGFVVFSPKLHFHHPPFHFTLLYFHHTLLRNPPLANPLLCILQLSLM